jgi:hypothetical protein
MRRLVMAAKLLLLVRAALPKYVAVLVAFGLLPLPGPVDEASLVLGLVLLCTTRWTLVKVIWASAGMETSCG